MAKTSPFMSLQIKFPIELTHGDRLGVDHKGVDGGEREPVGGQLALYRCQSVSEEFVTLYCIINPF